MAKRKKGSPNAKANGHVTVDHAAGEIGCSRMSVIRFLHNGTLRGSRLTEHGWWRVSTRSLEAYVAALAAQERAAKRKGR
jgi:hypothetical protein